MYAACTGDIVFNVYHSISLRHTVNNKIVKQNIQKNALYKRKLMYRTNTQRLDAIYRVAQLIVSPKKVSVIKYSPIFNFTDKLYSKFGIISDH